MFKVMAHFQVSLSDESKPSVINIVKMCTNQTLFGSRWAASKQVGGGDLRHELYKNEETLENSIQILQWCYYMSGLKINIQKTKVIRIGPIRETAGRFCRENDPEFHEQTSPGLDGKKYYTTWKNLCI